MAGSTAPRSPEATRRAGADAERVVQPYTVADDLGWKAVAVTQIAWQLQAGSLAGNRPRKPSTLTVTPCDAEGGHHAADSTGRRYHELRSRRRIQSS